MTVPVQTPMTAATATAGQTLFNFNFRTDDSTWLQVLVNNILRPGGDYVIALNADQTNNPGGTVTFVVGRALNDAVQIARVSPAQQVTHLTAYSPFQAATMEASLDRLVMLIQEIGITRQSITPVPIPGTPGTQVIEEIPGGAVNSTTGSDGNGVFTLAHAPLAGTLRFYVSGGRQPPARYTLVGNQVTFAAGQFPAAGEYICADYYY